MVARKRRNLYFFPNYQLPFTNLLPEFTIFS
jgi:hypothetical protein